MNYMKRGESGGVEIVDVIRDASSSKLELAEEAPSVAEQLPNDDEQFDDEDVNVNKPPVADGTVSPYQKKKKFAIRSISVLAIALFVAICVGVAKSTNNKQITTSSARASYKKAGKNVGVAKAAKASRGSKGAKSTPKLEREEGCVASEAEDLNNCSGGRGSTEFDTIEVGKKVSGQVSTFETNQVPDKDLDSFVFELPPAVDLLAGAIKVTLNVPKDAFKAVVVLGTVSTARPCAFIKNIGIAESTGNFGEFRILNDGSGEYVLTSDALAAADNQGTFQVLVFPDLSVTQPNRLSCDLQLGPARYTLKVEVM